MLSTMTPENTKCRRFFAIPSCRCRHSGHLPTLRKYRMLARILGLELLEACYQRTEGVHERLGIPGPRVSGYRVKPANPRPGTEEFRYWIKHNIYPPDDIAAQFHHRLVAIHRYPNGNGRHARLAADLLLKAMGRTPFSWGSTSLVDAGATRAAHIAALREADNHDYGPLIAFARS